MAFDPAGLTDLRTRFDDEVGRRWTKTAREVKRAIVMDDALGVGPKAPRMAQPAEDKAGMFKRWLDERLMHDVVGYDASWMARHVDAASQKACERGLPLGDAQVNVGFLVAGGAPSAKVCRAASVSALAGICDDVSQQAHASVQAGLLSQARPAQIARLLDKAFGRGLNRSRLLAEHAVTQAYSQGTLDALEARGVTHVGTISEHKLHDAEMQIAAGIMFVDPDGNALFLHRTDGEGWAFPGGGVEAPEGLEQGAVREAQEECGGAPLGSLTQIWRSVGHGVDFTTFQQDVDAQFEPTLNDEHDDWVWADPSDPPRPLHPGVAEMLRGYDLIDFDPDEPRDDTGKWTSVYHGTTTEFDKLRVNPEEDFVLDRMLGVHVAKDPEVANSFTLLEEPAGGGWWAPPGGRVIPLKLDESKFLPVDQIAGGYDQTAMDEMIMREAYKADPGMLARYLTEARAVPVGDAPKLAQTMVEGGEVTLPVDGPNYTLDRFLRNFTGARPYNKADRRRAVELARKSWQAQGFQGLRYIDTAPGEVEDATDRTAFVVFNPHDLVQRYTGQRDAARDTPQPQHPRSGQYAKAHVVAREMRRSKRTGQFRRQGLTPEDQRKEELREARFGRVKGKLDVLTAGDDRVCDVCDGISAGGPYTINTARGLIPAHIGCRCLFVPARSMALDFDPGEPRDQVGRWTALAGSQGHAALISTSKITKPGKTDETKARFAAAQTTYTQVSVAGMKQDERVYEHNIGLFKDARFYPGMRPDEVKGSVDDVAKAVTERIRSNLVFLANAVRRGEVPGVDFEANRKWYDGAHAIAEREAKASGIDIASAAGVIAALSPQKNWDENVYLAHAVFDSMSHPERKWDDTMSATSKAIWKGDNATLAKEIEGKSLGDLSDPQLAGMWIRTWEGAHGARQMQRVNPDGSFGDLIRNAPQRDGTLGRAALPSWGPVDAIANAVAAYRSGGDNTVLGDAMGERHKVRSFYNNILDPHSANGDVTIDTHAVGAAWLQPYTQSDAAVYHALKTNPGVADKPEGFVGAAGSGVNGAQGTYAVYADAYREAARDIGIEPRELQSITWSAKRALFADDTTGSKIKTAVNGVWKKFHDGSLSLEAAQSEVLRVAKEARGHG